MNPFRMPMRRRRRHRAPQPPTVTTPVTTASTTPSRPHPMIPREIEVPCGPPVEIVYTSSLTLSQGLAFIDENQQQQQQPQQQQLTTQPQHDSMVLQRLQEEYFLVHPQRVHSLLLLNSVDTVSAMLQQEQEERFLEQRLSRFPRPQHDNIQYDHTPKEVDTKTNENTQDKKPIAARKPELSSPTTSFLLQNSDDFRESFHSLCQAFPDADPTWILKLMKEQGQVEQVGQVLLALSSQPRPTLLPSRPTLSRHDSNFARQKRYDLKSNDSNATTTRRRDQQRLDRDNDDDMQLRRTKKTNKRVTEERQSRLENAGDVPVINAARCMREEMMMTTITTKQPETPNEREEIVQLVMQVFPSTTRRRILDLLVYDGYTSAQSIIVWLGKEEKRTRGRLY